jgi:hypothetical protein
MSTRVGIAAIALICALFVAAVPVAAQKQGGTLRFYHRDNPPSASLHEETTNAVIQAATCWQAHVKGIVLQQNSIYNNWRFEDVWIDK